MLRQYIDAIGLIPRKWWILTALPPLLVGAFSAVVVLAKRWPTDIRTATPWYPSVSTWIWMSISSVLVSLAIVQFVAWYEEFIKAKALRLGLQVERENITGCPQIILEFESGGFPSPFYVSNRGMADARCVKVKTCLSQHYTLTSNEISYIKGSQEKVAIIFHAEPNNTDTSDGSLDGMQAFSAIANDAEHNLHPLDVSVPVIDQLNDWSRFAECHHVLMSICVVYSDLIGKGYESQATIVWSPLVGEIVEVRPGIIRRSE